MVARNVLNDLLSLPPAERLDLVHRLWDSLLDDPINFPLSEEHKQELDRRYEDYLRNPADSSSWEEVEAFVRAKLRA